MESCEQAIDERLIQMKQEEINRDLIEILFRNLSGETEENKDKPQSR
jgi:hypothetical protein